MQVILQSALDEEEHTNLNLNENDLNRMVELYENRFCKYGYDPKSLGWVKGKQALRFSILSSMEDLNGKSILDIGCGFGDLFDFLSKRFSGIQYCGIDCTSSFIAEARKRYDAENAVFVVDEFLSAQVKKYDYVIGSGIFNYKLINQRNYDYIFNVMTKALKLSKYGVAFDFLSDKVDFKKYEINFHSDPAKIIDFCYKLSRNVVLRNDYAPFEFSIFIAKDDSFDLEHTIFNRYRKTQRYDP